ncbi:MAG: glutamine-hydrolyzing carbamoyl-phosphate synthase small subunit [Sandaracinaceae bacterium]|nr:glutamine-hydrolyzing carbamoyl-phosphate synthase small subunit [Sandaracinaceae bacterium]
MTERQKAHLVLADGTVFEGVAVGASGTTIGEAVFTTGMTGYQEVLTDPSYCGQIVVMTAPQIGNTGTNDEDEEAAKPHLAGFVMHELSSVVSNWRANRSLDAYLKAHGIVSIAGLDTRELTRHLRDHGAQMAAVGTEPVDVLRDKAAQAPSMSGQDLTGLVSTKAAYTWSLGLWGKEPAPATRHVVAIDFGVKQNILRHLVHRGCRVTVLPSTATAEDVLAQKPDGVFLSNGPGDPAAVTHGIETIRALVGKKPIFGICLGHQMLALALGGTTYKMKFGHRGLNHPVKDLRTGKIEITTQNHGFAVDVPSLASSSGGKCVMTHQHLNDGTCMGIEDEASGAFSVQYHPEASAGPHDASYLFDRFVARMG